MGPGTYVRWGGNVIALAALEKGKGAGASKCAVWLRTQHPKHFQDSEAHLRSWKKAAAAGPVTARTCSLQAGSQEGQGPLCMHTDRIPYHSVTAFVNFRFLAAHG